MQRDLFGRLLAISVEENIDLEKVLSYPLTPLPLALCHLDGTHCKTDKSALMKSLERSINSEPPAYTDVVLIDGFFFTASYEGLAGYPGFARESFFLKRLYLCFNILIVDKHKECVG